MSKYLPFENIIYLTKLSPDDLIHQILNHVQVKDIPTLQHLSDVSFKRYYGRISGSGFIIKRFINYRNSFLPVIKGTMTRMGENTQVEVHMRPAWFTLMMWFLLFGSLAVIFIFTIILCALNQQWTMGSAWVLLFVILVYVPGLYSFKSESMKSKQELIDILQADIIQEW